jgi:transketolase N-terminal domain/subunit
MNYNQARIDEVVLALLGASEFENGRVWKRIDFAVMDRLHEKGLITDPHGKQESVYLTATGLALARQLAAKYFAD